MHYHFGCYDLDAKLVVSYFYRNRVKVLDEKYFSKVFRRVMDMTPSEYKAGKNVAG